MSAPNKLTQAVIDGLVQSVQYHHHGTLTIAVVYLRNAGTVVGTSECVNPGTYDKEIGCKAALDNAKDKLWELEGYAIKTRGK